MGTEYLLDTNVVIGFLDKKLSVQGMGFVSEIINKTPNISVITKIELLRFNAPTIETGKILKGFVRYAEVLSLTDYVVDKTIEICKQNRIKLPDAIIAATCLVNNFTLLTQNVVDFKNIDNLKIQNPFIL